LINWLAAAAKMRSAKNKTAAKSPKPFLCCSALPHVEQTHGPSPWLVRIRNIMAIQSHTVHVTIPKTMWSSQLAFVLFRLWSV
jgi:hypothetical protein